MATTRLNEDRIKQAVKDALAETLQEQRELLHDIFAGVLEEFALSEAIRQGQGTKSTTREEIFRVLRPRK